MRDEDGERVQEADHTESDEGGGGGEWMRGESILGPGIDLPTRHTSDSHGTGGGGGERPTSRRQVKPQKKWMNMLDM